MIEEKQITKKKIAVLISGSGSNLQSIIDNCANGYINGEIEVVISSAKDAYGLTRAEKAGIFGKYIGIDNYGSFEDVTNAILSELSQKNIDLIILAGYIKVVSERIIEKYENRIINIHPSLIPSFCGKGFYGHHVHEGAYQRGIKLSGATAHFVDNGMDTGPIIIQECVAIDYEDDAETIAKKVLKIEHVILPKAVKLFCEDKLQVVNKRVKII